MEDFIFEWKIENFFLSVNKKGGYVSSPTFIVDSIYKTAWFLHIYPYGNENHTHVACYLNRGEIDGGKNGDISIDFNFSLVMADGSELLLKAFTGQNFPLNHRFGCNDLKRLDDILKDKNNLLPKGTLTIQCCMQLSRNAVSASPNREILKSITNYLYDARDSTITLPSEMYQAADAVLNNARSLLCPYPERCIARTRVRTEDRSITWRIENFTDLVKGRKMTLPMVSASKSSPSLLLTFYLDDEGVGNEHIKIDIRLKENTITTGINSECKITILKDKHKRSDYRFKDRYFFEAQKKDQVWKSPPIIKKSQLVEEKATYLKNDTLSLLFEITMSDGQTLSQIENTYYFSDESVIEIKSSKSLVALRNDLGALMTEAKLSDVSLLIGKEEIPAHKAILSARSPVFKAMFDREMSEKESGIVKVTDLDLDTVTRMLTYMYGGQVEDLQCESAAKLYSAADKYQCLGLKDVCANFLKENLSVANVCDVLILADMHEDEDLTASGQDFILHHLPQTLHSEEWKTFMKNKTLLACEILHHIGLMYFDD